MSFGQNNLPTVFFGSGPVAASCIELLLQHTPIEAVVTKSSPAHHRGKVPVLEIAAKHGLRVVTAATKAELSEVIAKESFSSQYAVLIDFGIIVEQSVIDHFESGIINSHFSLLPYLRGADPISFAILEGCEKTGVSLMLVDKGMDTGPLLAQQELKLTGNETTLTLTSDLIELSDNMLKKYIPQYLSGKITAHPQPNTDQATYSQKLTKGDGVLDLAKPAMILERQIRAFIDWPQSRTQIGSYDVIITKAHVDSRESQLSLKCGDGEFLIIDELKPAGKKTMSSTAFLAGYGKKLSKRK